MRIFWQRRSRTCFLPTHLPSYLPSCSPTIAVAVVMMIIAILMLDAPSPAFAQDKTTTSSSGPQVAKAVGVIKSIQPDSITVSAESGGEVIAKLTASTKIVRVPPGEKDLKNATSLQAQDLQPGDRVLVRGQASPDGNGHTISALAVIVMKQADVAAKQQHDRDDWQKRGVGGLVTQVDAATGTITVSSSGMGANRAVVVHIAKDTAKDTIVRRYAPGSVNFDDAKPLPVAEFMAEIKAGDQLRARGTRSPDGSEINAEEVVSGSFRNIAGTVKAIDVASNSITVQDAISKSAVVVKVSSNSQMKKLPAEMAQRIAMRLKSMAGGNGDQPGGNGNAQGQNQGQGQSKVVGSGQSAAPGAPGAEAQAGRGTGGNVPPDFQRMLGRLPNSTLADLQKGDAVMIVSTETGSSDSVTAITLLAGVEPILTAAPNRSASSLLSPWSLGAQGGEGEGSQ